MYNTGTKCVYSVIIKNDFLRHGIINNIDSTNDCVDFVNSIWNFIFTLAEAYIAGCIFSTIVDILCFPKTTID